MNFDFIPYQLNADISDFKGNIEYISSDNGVDLYKAKHEFMKLILGFSVTLANLYFFEGTLITAYIQLGKSTEQLQKIKAALEKTILEKAKIFEANSEFVYYWQDKCQLLGLFIHQSKNMIILYHSLNKFNILNQ